MSAIGNFSSWIRKVRQHSSRSERKRDRSTHRGSQRERSCDRTRVRSRNNSPLRTVVVLRNTDQNRNRSTKATTVKRQASTDKTDGPAKPPGPVAQQEITRLEALCEARTKELNYTKMQLKARITSFEAMTALVKYMSEELNAFECPQVTAELARVKHHLEQASSQLGALEREKNTLAEHVANIRAQHTAERDMLVMEHHKFIRALEERLKNEANQRVQAVIDKHSHEVTTLRNFHERDLNESKSSREKSLLEKDKECDAKMSYLKKEHELHVTDLQKHHHLKLEEITSRFDNIKVTLLDKVDILRRECEEMRAREKMYVDQCQRDSDHKLQIALQPYKNLPAEIESLKTVIEMRSQEIHDLRRRNLDLETQRDDLLAAKDRIKNLLQQKENLEAIVHMKAEYEKQLSEKHQVLMRRYDKESKANKRLSMDKEELTWRLSQSEYTMSGSFSLSGSPDVVRRTISHSPTSPVPNMSASLPDGSSSILRRKKSPSALAPSNRHSGTNSSSSENRDSSGGENGARSSSPGSKSTSPRDQSPKFPKDKDDKLENKTNLKRSGTYDLLDREDLDIDLKQSDV